MKLPRFDNADVGQVHPHPKASLAQKPKPTQSGVAGIMMLAVVVGAFLGYLVSFIVGAYFAFPFVIVGAMAFGAGAVVLFLLKTEEGEPQGNVRSEAEVRQALSDIEARKK
ncbi:hypothetical protein [Tateyamaria sp.]|uniref:hypothetical protein n=1 Tax=Tateyamaria sp. TaxID=1929288 RepID=UPI0032A0CEEE